MSKQRSGKFPLMWAVLSGVSVLLAILFTVAWVVTGNFTKVINQALGLSSTKTIRLEEDEGKEDPYVSDYADMESLKKADMEVAERLTEEGAVLLKNNGVLPLKNDAKVTILGHSSTNMLVCGTGSADIDATLDVEKYGSKLKSIDGYLTLKGAIEERTGMRVNETVWNAYMKWTENRTYVTNPEKGDNSIRGGNGNAGQYSVNEVPWSTLTAQSGVTSSFNNYSDAAIVVVSRLGGEMYDIPSSVASQGNPTETVDGSGNALELTINEIELIRQAKAQFGKVVVLVNSANAIECDFLTKENSDVDAALWIGYTGLVGLYGVADLLVGNANPSGRLVDTYCNDNLTSPAMMNFYSSEWTNASSWGADMTGKAGGDLDGNRFFNVYQEGIYVGYRYYETRYADAVKNQGNTAGYNYLADVAYPFGYGLSYTTFTYSDVSFTPTEKDGVGGIAVSVKVTNTGDHAGKDVVEVYFQSEYTDYDRTNGIEKSAIELCGFAKTALLDANGGNETVEIFVPYSEFRTYDRNGAGTYIMDEGQYYITVGTDAHDALNNILAKQNASGMVVAGDKATVAGDAEKVYGWHEDMDTVTYSKSYENGEDGYDIENQFESAELSYYGGTDVTYLSRSDWQGTFPTKQSLELTQAMHDEMTGIKQYEKVTVEGETMPTMGSTETNYKLKDMIGLDYDDPLWDKLLNQVTYQEMADVIGLGYHGTQFIESISKPETKDENGPQGFSAKLTDIFGSSVTLCAYSDENIMAATWNVELMKEVGEHIGEDGLWSGYSGLYGPAMNTHRSPYGGRNFEYYSEDGFLAGKIAAAEVEGIQSKGVYVFVKHFALNDVETNCRAVSTFVNEQAIREIYLQPFEKAIVEGGAYNVMNAFSRIGVIWSGAHYGLMTEVLRNEWGCRGFGISDYTNTSYATTAHSRGTYDVLLGVLAGTDTFDSNDANAQKKYLLTVDSDNDPHLVNCMREATHRICYVVANSNAMNNSGTVVGVMNWWQFALIDGIVDSCIATVVFATFTVIGCVRYAKAKKQDVSEAQEA